MKKIAVTNLKGGVAKTTSTLNIAGALREKGYKVLVIDLDSQGSLTRSLYREQSPLTIGEVLTKQVSLKDAVIGTETRIDLLPSDHHLSKTEKDISSEPMSEFFLQKALKPLRGYDFVLLDCPPALSTITINALMAADYYLIPLEADFYSLEAVSRLRTTAEKLVDFNDNLSFLGAFIVKYEANRILDKQAIEAMSEDLGKDLLTTYIRKSQPLKECVAMSQDIFSYSPKSNGAIDYMSLTEEILKRVQS